jgi:hypothetical protein
MYGTSRFCCTFLFQFQLVSSFPAIYHLIIHHYAVCIQFDTLQPFSVTHDVKKDKFQLPIRLIVNTISTMEQPHDVEILPRPQTVYLDSTSSSPHTVRPDGNMPVMVEDDVVSLAPTTDTSGHHSKREKIKIIAHQIKEVPHRMLMRADIITKAHPEMDADGKEIPGITDSPAFNTGMLDAPEHGTAATMALKPVHAIQNVGHFIAHPRSHATKKAAGQLTVEETPYLGEGMDEELLEAHNKLEAATTNADKSIPAPGPLDDQQLDQHVDVDEDSEVEEARYKIHELQTRREELKTAWITGKHVRRAKAVRLPMVDRKPNMDEYNEYDIHGNLVRWKWEMYAGKVSRLIETMQGTELIPEFR